MALLKLLASEAAISIENARLYRDLHEREARVRRLIDANIIGIFICTPTAASSTPMTSCSASSGTAGTTWHRDAYAGPISLCPNRASATFACWKS